MTLSSVIPSVRVERSSATAAEVTLYKYFAIYLQPKRSVRRANSVGTPTVLFTALRHSTQLYREIGDATASAACLVFRRIEEAIVRQMGRG